MSKAAVSVLALLVLGVVTTALFAVGAALAATTPVAPPQPTIPSGPSTATASTGATFTYTNSQTGVSFSCSLDGSAFSSCATAGVTYSGLADGAHTFKVAAQAGKSALSTPAARSWTVDSTPPAVVLAFPAASGAYSAISWSNGCTPSGICGTASDASDVQSVRVAILQQSSARYWNGSSFSSSALFFNAATGTTGWGYALSARPPDGSYTVSVSASDTLGNTTTSAHMLSAAFSIDTTPPPLPVITAAPANPSFISSGELEFKNTEAGVVLRCQLDGGALSACNGDGDHDGDTSSALSWGEAPYANLAVGSHCFGVQATDAVGNTTAAVSSCWTISGPPTVTGVSPTAGSSAGGTAVTVTGTNFIGVSVVRLGTTAATNFTVNPSGTSLTATSPAEAAATVDVRVTNPAGTSAIAQPADQFSFGAPVLTSVTPTAGPIGGGTTVGIAGTGFTRNAMVSFGSTAATTVTVNSPTSITATSPAGSVGTVDVRVSTPAGQSPINQPGDEFTFGVPSVAVLSPVAGPTGGGTTVAVIGAGFTTNSTVRFGSVAATSVTFLSPTSLTAKSPAEAAGTVDLTVTTPAGTSALNAPGDNFTFGAPSVTSVSPGGGPVAGGTTVTVTGSGFSTNSTVRFGAGAATNVAVTSPTSLTARSPAGSLGTVNVTVTTPAGTSPTVAADGFAYEGAPVATSVSPTAGPTAGGTTVTVTGSNLYGASAVAFGSSTVSSFSVNATGTSLTVVSPAGASGTVDVRVTTPSGTSALNPPGDDFTFGIPTVTAVAPTAGPTTGATTVTVTGSGFTANATVRFGSLAATNVVVASSTSLTAKSPAEAAGTVDVTVTTPAGTSAVNSPIDTFTFGIPTVTAVAPTAGPTTGATTVTVTGSGFTANSTVRFGSVAATSVVFVSPTSLTAKSPAEAAGTVDVTVTTPAGTSGVNSPRDYFTFGAPAVTAISPALGSTAGGTAVTVKGTGFSTDSIVRFGTVAATNVVVASPTSLTAISPAGSIGTVHVTVTTPGGTSATSAADRFTYEAAPTVTSVTPTAGPTSGATTVTVTGTNLFGTSAVSFGTTAGSGVTVNAIGTSLTVVSPAEPAGTVDVRVTTPVGQSATSQPADRFTFGAPTVTSVSPSAGPTSGGATVTVSGTGFTANAILSFGSLAASVVSVNSPTSITVTSPASPAGMVDVRVSTPGGQSPISQPGDEFTFGAPTVTLVSPTAGPTSGATTVTITGSGFTTGAAVRFGSSAAASVTFISPTSLRAISPAELAGTVDVTVATAAGTSAINQPGDEFTFGAPTVISLSPNSDSTSGGTTVTITGSGFTTNSTVVFGSAGATGVTFVSPTALTAVSPAGSGTVDVQVTNPAGASATSPGDRFSYQNQSFTISGNASQSFSPGVTQPLNLVITNPVSFAIKVTGVTVTIADATTKAGVANPACSGIQNLVVTRAFNGTVVVPANSTRSLSDLSTPADQWPLMQMPDLATNQDACKSTTFSFTYTGTATTP